jgi:hypothetical protein
MADILKAKDKVENPEAHFDKPKEIVQDKALSQHEKMKALSTLGAGRATVIDSQQ